MAPYTRGQKRDNTVFVLVNPILLYGFKTKDLAAAAGVSQADLSTKLGHTDAVAAAGVAGGVRVIGVNAPKPPRVSKRLPNATINQAASVSTFCAYNKLATASTDNWGLIKSARGVSLQPNAPGRRSVTAVATLSNAIRYAFPMNAADFETAKAALGLQQSSQITDLERRTLISGSTSTRPGQASLQLDNGILTSFYSTDSADNATLAGWSLGAAERVYDPAGAPA